MIQHSVDEDGALVLTVEGGPAAAPLREELLLWILGRVTAPAPLALPAPRPALDAEVSEEPQPTPPPPARPHRTPPARRSRTEAPLADSMSARILEAVQAHGPCTSGVIWKSLGKAVPVGPQDRARLKALVHEGVVTAAGPKTRLLFSVATPGASGEHQ